MPLTFNVRHLEQKDLHLQGELSANELELNGVDELIRVDQPVRYDLHVQRLENAVLVQGRVTATLACECVRCLKPFTQPLELPQFACLLELTGDNAVRLDNDSVDLTPILREDMLLAFPQHPLCKTDCGGLQKPGLGRSQSPGAEADTTSSPWDALNKLKLND